MQFYAQTESCTVNGLKVLTVQNVTANIGGKVVYMCVHCGETSLQATSFMVQLFEQLRKDKFYVYV